MALTDPATIARWVIEAGWTSNRDRTKAVAVAIASGSDPDRAGGLFGIGGPSGDGPGQARHAQSAHAAQGWSVFPAARDGRDILFLPIAVTAVAAAAAAGAVASSPIGQAVGNVGQAVTAPARAAMDLSNTTNAFLSYFSTENAWKRAVKFGLGMGMIVVAATRITSATVIKPLVGKVGDAANTIIAGKIVKSSASSAAESVRRRGYRGRHTAEGAPIRDSSATEVVETRK